MRRVAGRRRRRRKPRPTFGEEARLIGEGYSFVAGVDEVGRGPLAGPVVAGVAVLPRRPRGRWVQLVRDSKELTRSQREEVLPHLRDVALALEVGVSTAEEVDHYGIVGATYLAMRRAIDAVPLRPQFLLVDGFPVSSVSIPQKAIIHGDALCLSIAAASIVAKVTRDELMHGEDEAHPGYGFARHKGYATPQHLRNLRRLGPCPIHRYSFAPIRDWEIGR